MARMSTTKFTVPRKDQVMDSNGSDIIEYNTIVQRNAVEFKYKGCFRHVRHRKEDYIVQITKQTGRVNRLCFKKCSSNTIGLHRHSAIIEKKDVGCYCYKSIHEIGRKVQERKCNRKCNLYNDSACGGKNKMLSIYSQPKSTDDIISSTPSNAMNSNENSVSVGLIIGVIFAVIATISFVICAVLLTRRYIARRKNKDTHNDESHYASIDYHEVNMTDSIRLQEMPNDLDVISRGSPFPRRQNTYLREHTAPREETESLMTYNASQEDAEGYLIPNEINKQNENQNAKSKRRNPTDRVPDIPEKNDYYVLDKSTRPEKISDASSSGGSFHHSKNIKLSECSTTVSEDNVKTPDEEAPRLFLETSSQQGQQEVNDSDVQHVSKPDAYMDMCTSLNSKLPHQPVVTHTDADKVETDNECNKNLLEHASKITSDSMTDTLSVNGNDNSNDHVHTPPVSTKDNKSQCDEAHSYPTSKDNDNSKSIILLDQKSSESFQINQNGVTETDKGKQTTELNVNIATNCDETGKLRESEILSVDVTQSDHCKKNESNTSSYKNAADIENEIQDISIIPNDACNGSVKRETETDC